MAPILGAFFMTNRDNDVLKHLGAVKPRKEDVGAFWIGAFFLLTAIAVPAFQGVMWLKTGIWSPLSIGNTIGHFPPTDWVGIDKILAWLVEAPIWSIPAFLAFGSFSAWRETK
jgi:hypothetical protein